MALPNILRRLFKADGYGPFLKDEIVSRHISVQNWSNTFDYPAAAVARGADGVLYYSVVQSGPNTGTGAVDPTTDDGTYWTPIPTDNSDVVHKTGDENIDGSKTFKKSIVVNNGDPCLYLKNSTQDSLNPGTSDIISGLFFHDKNDIRLFELYTADYQASGQTAIYMGLAGGANKATYRSVSLFMEANGSPVFRPNPTNTNDVNLGSGSYKWKQLFATTSSINTSDERLKSSIASIPDEVLDAWGEIGFVQFQFIGALKEKGSDARLHSGLIAQRIDEAFRTRGLDASRYGLFCHDAWEAEPERRNADGIVVEPAHDAGDEYSLRYEEALCMEAAYQRRRADRAEARLAALEERLAAIEAKLG